LSLSVAEFLGPFLEHLEPMAFALLLPLLKLLPTLEGGTYPDPELVRGKRPATRHTYLVGG
jgi:hypothetical protein